MYKIPPDSEALLWGDMFVQWPLSRLNSEIPRLKKVERSCFAMLEIMLHDMFSGKTDGHYTNDNIGYHFSGRREIGISIARFLSMCMIISCHIAQRDSLFFSVAELKVYYSDWLNVGVQCFLFISGYLYGKKRKVEILSHYKKSFSRILVDYYLYIIPVLLLIYVTDVWNWEITSNDVLKLLTFSGHTQGFGHLWFIKNIMLCYLMTPALLELINTLSDKYFELKIVLLGVVFHIIIVFMFPGFKPACFNCFWLGIAWFQAKNRNRVGWQTVVFCSFLILFAVEMKMAFMGINERHRNIFNCFEDYCHNMLGASFVIFICTVCSNKQIDSGRMQKVLVWSDKYSYDVYLTHFVFFWSPFDVIRRIDNRLLAIIVALILTFVAASILYYFSNLIRTKILKISA